ncbi:electron transfer flavoprotein-ubiquinone oxidoreductase [Azospirillum sp. TSO22-1]|uniref:electron transfer flavoprotein-ubiquinone oxidoreductase n=1 Tax=Azospirillum sp. TSO22-1 TaxID=716789 RepID=UPI000D61D198|nr:electron transfer flavoprotein-ubiquinone oxidoreductase [Azospirillum sp. TSO22-1]PWC35400.1 electron transfer flavoprotein-ubiquinone oxidoreductase [Azospirillum sp. TSO22-1]
MTTRTDREAMEYDVVVVGAGPSGLAAAIRLKQTAPDLSVCVLEKGSEVGAHILSGAVMEPHALDELIPDWREKGAPLDTPAGEDTFLLLTRTGSFRLPTPPTLHNHGNYIVSLGKVCRWLAAQAEELGVEIFPGFAAAEVLYDEDGAVRGVATGDMGLGRDGEPTSLYTPGMELHARQTIFAEGCRGSLAKTVIARFALDRDCDPQVYGLGIKELWEIDPAKHKPGSITHTVGWPLDTATYGGSFLYHLGENLVAVGFVVGLGYENPHLSPFDEFQRFKTHPAIRPTFEGGRRIAYGARAIAAGGWQSLPKLSFPGGVLVGDTAGFLNAPKIKGSHAAMKSGMLAADAVAALLADGQGGREAAGYEPAFKASWLARELHAARNIKPAFKWGLWPAMAYAALDTYVLRGKAPWTLRHATDHDRLKPASACPPIAYPKPDGVVSFDRLSSVYLSNTNHEENQPVHLRLKDPEKALSVNLTFYESPETRYCPAGVYEIVRSGGDGGGEPRLQINAQNCLHCKTCDIKDPTQNIDWTCPEGSGGPNYAMM